MKVKPICKVTWCDSRSRHIGYCGRHYKQMYRHGKILERTRYDPNIFTIKGDICEITLFSDEGNKCAIALVDTCNYDLVKQHKWGLDGRGMVTTHIKGKCVALHNFILDRKGSRKIQVDHKDMDRLDNRRSEIRLCSNSQNNMNVGLRSDNVSGYKGVCWYNRDKVWCARLWAGGELKLRKYFKELPNAVKAYVEAAKKYHGEFMRLERSI